MTAEELLDAARVLLDHPDENATGAWPLGAAVLIRQAIEWIVDDFWRAKANDMRFATWTEQWIALPSFLGHDRLVVDANYAWSALSEAAHHRGYDVGLTADELESHLTTARAFGAAVGETDGDPP